MASSSVRDRSIDRHDRAAIKGKVNVGAWLGRRGAEMLAGGSSTWKMYDIGRRALPGENTIEIRNGWREERCSASAGSWQTRGFEICSEEDGTTRVPKGSQGRSTGCGGSASIETSGWLTGGATPIAFRSPPVHHSIPRESEQESENERRS